MSPSSFPRSSTPPSRPGIAALAAALVLPGTLGAAAEIGFVETFALADDRAAALEQLVPGTEEFYFFRCLHLLATERFAEVEPLLAEWIKTHGETPGVDEIRARKALLSFAADPPATADFLVASLGLSFDHERVVPGAEPQLPTALAPEQVSADAWARRASDSAPGTLDGWKDPALRRIAAGMEPAAPLDRIRRRQLLSRLARPDIPDLVRLVADDLREPDSGGFGSLPIHRALTRPQLEEVVRSLPGLRDDATVVTAMLLCLQPSPDEDHPGDDATRRAALERLEPFVRSLGAAHNSLKAIVLHERLVLDRKQGRLDAQVFRDYLALPRHLPYVSPELLATDAARGFPCNLGQPCAGCPFPPVGDDEALVRDLLGRFLVDAPDTRAWEPFFEKGWLDRVFAETKLLAGLGNAEQHAAVLGPAAFRALRDRVDIDLLPSNPTRVAVDDPVALDVALKNVPELAVRIFAIDTLGHYRGTLTEVDTDIPLDGLTPTAEFTVRVDEPALRRTVKRVPLPQLAGPGVWVVDFVGNGRSSRALVRKGWLRALVEDTAAGQRFTVLDDAGRKVTGARLWFEGREQQADGDGTILVPPSTAPARKPIVVTGPITLADGTTATVSTLDAFVHRAESLELTAAIHVDRESLRTRRSAEVIVRPALLLERRPVSLAAIEEPRLTIRSVDSDGVPAVREVAPFPLFEDRDSVHEFLVPPRLAEVTFTLSGKVRRITAGDAPLDVSASRSLAVNQIDRTDKVENLFLVRSGERFLVEVRGRGGEPRGSQPVVVTLEHRDVRQTATFSLKTDAAGAIDLGPLDGIEVVTVTGPEGVLHAWPLRPDRVTRPQVVHGRVGAPVRVSWLPAAVHRTGRAAGAPTPADVALFELRGGAYAVDRFAHLAVEQGNLVLRDLPAGDYELFFPGEGARVEVRITDGAPVDGFFVGRVRQLEAPRLSPTAIESVTVEGDGEGQEVVIRLGDPNPFTRVHLLATRMAPDFDPFAALATVRAAEPWAFARRGFSNAYVSGRNLGDEIAYVLRRRAEPPFAGTMLDRPSVLLHPWAVEDTTTVRQEAAAGDDFAAVADAPMSMAKVAAPGPVAGGGIPTSFADLDFLADDPPVVPNLVPAADGTIRVRRADLAGHQDVTVVVVDPALTLARSVALPARAPRIVETRFRGGLDPARHFVQRQTITLVGPADGPIVIEDATSGRFEAYDSLGRVFGLATAVSGDRGLAAFAFLLRWPSLDDAEKRRLASEHACHELHFFLWHKDRPFFDAVVAPGLRTKKDRTFLDRWLLGDDLSPWLEPWRYARLNVAERALLARRVAAEQPRTRRHLADLLAVLPPDTERRQMLFDAAVSADALGTEDRFGRADADNALPADAEFGFRAGGGGMGGMGGGLGGSAAGTRGGALGSPPPAAAAPESLSVEGRTATDKNPMLGRDMARRDEARGSLRGRSKRKLQEGESIDRFGADPAALDDAAGKPVEFFARQERLAEALYRLLDPTREHAENNYHHLRIAAQDASLIGPSRFWLDYAAHDPATPFRSVHLGEASRSFAETLLALAVLDLPYESPEHRTSFADGKMTIEPAGPIVAFHERTTAVDPPAAPSSILVGQNVLRQSEREEIVDGEPRERFVTGEFLTHVVYTSRVVVTNTGSARRKVAVLLQIPQGSIPVLGSRPTRTAQVVLEPYAVEALEYSFVFPAAGEFAHYPAHVSEGDALVAFVPPTAFTVVDRPARPDDRSWAAVSQEGSDEQVLAWLDAHVLDGVDLGMIAWRMKDRGMFDRVTAKLASRHVWDRTLWSYAFLHRDPAAMRTWLEHEDEFVALLGGRIEGGLMPLDPVERRTYEHLEYWPLVNARQFMLGSRRQIVNDAFHGQYHRFLGELARARSVSDDDRLAAVVYLLLQDRVAEATRHFARVRREATETPLHYDYADAILALHAGDTDRARAIALRNAGFPVERWRRRFELVLAHVDEAAGRGDAAVLDPLDREQRQGRLAAASPALALRVEGRDLVLDHENLATATVALHEMDLEVLFSRNPFAGTFAGQFGSVRPNRTFDVALDAGGTTRVALPAEAAARDQLVTVTAGGITRSAPAYSTGLTVRVMENYAQVIVTMAADGKPVVKAYCKVYARMDDGRVAFYKDGFTDIRGRFDYASLSTPDAASARRFSILVTSPGAGSAVREADPPPR